MSPANRASPAGNLSCHMKFFSPAYHVMSVYITLHVRFHFFLFNRYLLLGFYYLLSFMKKHA